MTTVNSKAIGRDLKRESSLALKAVKRFGSDQCSTMAASIAFYAAFSLAPTLLMVIAVAGFFFGEEAARGQLFARVHDFLGDEPAKAIQAIVENAHRGGSGWAALLSIGLLIVGASATFSSLNTALDRVFPAVASERHSGIALMLRVRLMSFGLVLGVGFLLVVSLVLDTAVSLIGKMIWGNSPMLLVTDIVQLITSLAILSLAFTALMKLLPDARVKWRAAMVGGVVSAVLFTIGKKLFAIYLAHAGTASAFGAAGSLAVLLMWLYFSSAVLLLGAEFAAVKGGFDLRKDANAAALATAEASVGNQFAEQERGEDRP
jgi:membrane protein